MSPGEAQPPRVPKANSLDKMYQRKGELMQLCVVHTPRCKRGTKARLRAMLYDRTADMLCLPCLQHVMLRTFALKRSSYAKDFQLGSFALTSPCAHSYLALCAVRPLSCTTKRFVLITTSHVHARGAEKFHAETKHSSSIDSPPAASSV